MESLKISVLGAGHGGLATTGHVALKGNFVTIFSFFSNELLAIDERKGIKLEGDVEGFADNIKTAHSIIV
ncbi:MAG: hypothetical protein SNJ70_05595 [Armatimonadota bacterium]